MEAIVVYLLKSAGILAIFFFSYQLFLRKETFFKVNRHYLLAGILGSLLLPMVIFTQYVYVEPVAAYNQNWLFSDIPITYNSVETSEPFNWLQFATYVYLIGVIVFGIRFAIQLTSLVKLFMFNTIKKRDGYNLIEINSNMSPFSFFNYIVYNPKRYNKKDLDIIINHEKAHSNQFHSLDILLSQFFVILQWFNPIAWFYKKSIQQNLEFMADQFAISKVESAQQYQRTLLKASLKPQYASITNNFYNSLIKKRIIMLNQSKSNIRNAWKYFVILPALALFLMSFNVETVEVVKEPRELPTASDLSIIFDNNLLTNFNAISNNNVPSKVFSKKMDVAQLKVAQKIIEAKIDKNTTDQKLKDIATSLKKDGIEFSFKNVKRNANNEITGISVTYKDSNGNTGNYALSSENPINAFRFYKEENGSIGFKSENVNAKKYREFVVQRELSDEKRDEMMKEREIMMQERMKYMEEREAMSEERRQELEERMEKAHAERKDEMIERRKEMEIHMKEARKEHAKAREEHEKQRKIIIKERIKLHDSLKDKHGNIFIIEENDNDGKEMFFSGKSKAMFIVDGEEEDEKIIELLSPDDIAHINVLKGDHAIKMYGKKGKDGVIVIKTKPHGENEFEFDNDFTESNVEVIVDPNMEFEWVSEFGNVEIQTIDKNTSNENLKAIKSDFKSKNIDFSYSKLKRNNDGEITRIKISLNDNDGNKSSSTFDKGNKAISPVLIGKNRSNLIIKSI